MTPRRKVLIALWAFAILSIAAIVIAAIYRSNQPTEPVSTQGTQTTTTDPTTGETIIETEGKVPEGATSQGVLILGLSKLNEYGISSVQTDIVNDAFVDYAADKSTNTKVERISLDSTNMTMTINQDTGQTDITAEVVINQKERQKVLLSYMGTKDMLVRFYSLATGEQTFISEGDLH